MTKVIKAGLIALSGVFAGNAAFAQDHTMIDLTKLDGFSETVGDKLQYGNEDFDLSRVHFFKLDDAADRLPTMMCVDNDRNGIISKTEDYAFNVPYASMIFSVKGEQGIMDINGPVAAKRIMTEIKGIKWAVLQNNGGEPVAIAVNTDQGLMISAVVPDFPRGDEKIRTPFGPCVGYGYH